MKTLNSWHEAYSEIAKALDRYYQYNQSAQNLYRRLERTEYFRFNLKRLERKEGLLAKGLDPIQIFATFNYSRIKDDDRVKCINHLFKALDTKFEIDRLTSFEGVPTPIIAKVIRYRGWNSQNQIWDMFHNIVEKGIDALEEKHFIWMEEWSGIDIAAFTIFLFWVNSEVFLPLDKNTVRLLKEFELVKSRPKKFHEYFDICFKVKLESEKPDTEYKEIIRNFVKDAYDFIKKDSTDIVLSGSTASFIVSSNQQISTTDEAKKIAQQRKKEYFKGFRIIALKPKKIPRSTNPQRHLKNLQEEQLYQLFSCYTFVNNSDEEITYNSNLDLDIYDHNDNDKNINISISTIVGKNGSGKSTLIELLYLTINKIAFHKDLSPTGETEDEEVYADLYIKSDSIYKISVGSSVEIFKYELNETGNKYDLQPENITDEFDIENFCYTLVVNYSLYGLNSKIMGPWLNPLFHKNDSYQLPIVLNPMRNEGNIDVNNEEYLAKSRLLANLLDPENISRAGDIIPELVPNSTPEYLFLSFDHEKMKRKRENYRKKYKQEITLELIDKVISALEIKPLSRDLIYFEECCEYIYLKLVSISEYPKFSDYKDMPGWVMMNQQKLTDYINDVFKEGSHIAFKLLQAINYLKYGLYQKEGRYNILDLSQEINNKQEKTNLEQVNPSEKSKKEIRTIELVPPPFFDTDIFFTYGDNFGKLSSGEKQQILSINTVAYHLYNLDSVSADGKGYKYNCINIVFDEVELYFHPEMQRTYINNLRDRIISLDLHDIDNINIIFVTHSPFIISDLPKENVLKLELNPVTRKSMPLSPEKNTFSANIHELLTDDFFLSHTMGEYSKIKINEIIDFYSDVRKTNVKELQKNKTHYQDKLEYCRKISNSIGEDFLKGIIDNHIEFIQERLNN